LREQQLLKEDIRDLTRVQELDQMEILAKLSPHLEVFANQLKIKHIFQVGIQGDFVDQDVFTLQSPTIIPAKTFLSQLV